jgi:predicted ATPase
MESAPFGRLLREFRLARGLTQESLAELAAMSVNGISALERGANQAPQRKTLELIVRALELDPEQERELEEAAARPSRPRYEGHARKGEELPRALTPFFGRERALSVVADFVDARPLVTLTGAGGVGKTRLALRVAEELAGRFHDGVYFVDLTPLRDVESALFALSARLGLKAPCDEAVLPSLLEALHAKNVLVIFDNCEHLVTAFAPAVEQLVESCANVRVLATSRQPLGIPGEQLFRVPSLELDAAVDLFVERAKRSVEGVTFSQSDRGTIARIVQRLDGIALAIELAAARLNLLALPQLEERLSERLHILSAGSSTTLRRHQTMRAAIDWSYELLGENERHVFDRLWVFPSSFSLDAALAVCVGDPQRKWSTFEALASLVDKSLVDSAAESGVQRYRLLETTRAYVAERSRAIEDCRSDLRSRHAAFYCDLAESAASSFQTTESTKEWARSLESDGENFRIALDWLINERGDVAAGARLLFNLQEFWIAAGLAAEASGRAHKLLEMEPDLAPGIHAGLWLTIARMRQELFVHPGLTLEAATNARELYEDYGDSSGLALAIRQQAAAHMRMGSVERAQEEFQQSLQLYRELGDRRMVARGLGYLASLQLVQGDYPQARTTLLDVLQAARATGDDRMIPTVLMNLAEAEFALGESQAAVERAYENLSSEVMQKTCDMLATQEANLSAYLLAVDRPEEARAMAFASIDNAEGSFIAVPLQHFAASIAYAHPACASRILGYVEAAFETAAFSRQHTERFTLDYLRAAVRTGLDEETLAEYRNEGAGMSEKQILSLARHASESLVTPVA